MPSAGGRGMFLLCSMQTEVCFNQWVLKRIASILRTWNESKEERKRASTLNELSVIRRSCDAYLNVKSKSVNYSKQLWGKCDAMPPQRRTQNKLIKEKLLFVRWIFGITIEPSVKWIQLTSPLDYYKQFFSHSQDKNRSNNRRCFIHAAILFEEKKTTTTKRRGKTESLVWTFFSLTEHKRAYLTRREGGGKKMRQKQRKMCNRGTHTQREGDKFLNGLCLVLLTYKIRARTCMCIKVLLWSSAINLSLIFIQFSKHQTHARTHIQREREGGRDHYASLF